MSIRTLQKLRGEDDLTTTLSKINDEPINSTDEEIGPPSFKPTKGLKSKSANVINSFDLLKNDEDTNDIIENDDEHNSSNKKRKKKKKKKLPSQNLDSEIAKKLNEYEDDIDRCVAEVDCLVGDFQSNRASLETTHQSKTALASGRILQIEHKNLNPENEMKRIFGSKVVQNESRNRRDHRRTHRKNFWLAVPKQNWPPHGKLGLSMNLINSERGCNYFTFHHNRSYQQAQFLFYDSVESLNPQNIVEMVHAHPYHIDGLLQLSEISRMGEDLNTATELVERALFSFEMNFHTLFSLTQGNSRLDYRRPENRSFYLALFRQMVFVGNRGCHRTALEFCKLILSLDPDNDPLCSLLTIDFYALWAKEYNFLIRLYHEWEVDKNLSQLPNFAFSVPLAMFHHCKEEDMNLFPADNMLQNSLLMYPGVLMPLLDKCNVNPDSRLSSHQFFSVSSQLQQPEALRQLTALYVGRCYPSWKEPEVLSWLERNVHETLDRVDKNDPIIQEYKTKCLSRYKGTPRNIYRHIIISEIKDATATLPPELANKAVLSFDPLPPSDSINSYTRPKRTTSMSDENAISLFLRSLMPNFDPQAPPAEDEGAAGPLHNQIRQSLTTLMDAMRELLINVPPLPDPEEEEPEQNNNEEWD